MRNSTKCQENSKKHTVKILEFLVKFWHAEGSISKNEGVNSNENSKKAQKPGPNTTKPKPTDTNGSGSN